MNLVEELEKLNALHSRGALSDEEFRKAKDALLSGNPPADLNTDEGGARIAPDESAWGLLIHLSQFCGYLLPLAGVIVPLTLWLVKKNDSRVIDQHGRIVMNWLISALIYAIVLGFLCIIVIGIPFVIVLGILAFIYPIIGAVKASSGETWSYPGSIRFLSVND